MAVPLVDIHKMAKKGETEALSEALQQAPTRITEINIHGNTPLLYACFFNKIETIRMLIARGVPVNQFGDVDKFGRNWTALHISCEYGFSDIAVILLRAGADSLLKDSLGETPLELCGRSGKTPSLRDELVALAKTLPKPVSKPYIAPVAAPLPIPLPKSKPKGEGDKGERATPAPAQVVQKATPTPAATSPTGPLAATTTAPAEKPDAKTVARAAAATAEASSPPQKKGKKDKNSAGKDKEGGCSIS